MSRESEETWGVPEARNSLSWLDLGVQSSNIKWGQRHQHGVPFACSRMLLGSCCIRYIFISIAMLMEGESKLPILKLQFYKAHETFSKVLGISLYVI